MVYGIVSVSGSVSIDGQRATEGQTIFAPSSLVTNHDSETLIVLSNLTRLNVAAQTDLTVDFSATRVAGSLTAGRLTGFVPAGVSLEFQTTDLSIGGSAASPVIFTIETGECVGTRLSVESGRLITKSAGRTHTVEAGETLSTFNPEAPTPPKMSGKQKAGVVFTIGGALAILLAVALGRNDDDQENPGDFGGQVTAPSPR